MRSLNEIFKSNKVWIYCGTDELQEAFLKQARDDGFTCPTDHSYLYSILPDKTICYLSTMIWCMSFGDEHKEITRVDYGKFAAGEKNYLCERAYFEREGLTVTG